MKQIRVLIILVFLLYATVFHAFGAENRLPKNIEDEIIKEYSVVEKLLKDGNNDEAFKAVKNILNKIKGNYPTGTKDLFQIGTQYTGSMFQSVFYLFIKNRDFLHAEELTNNLMKDLPYNFACMITAHEMGDVYNYELNDSTKAIEFYQRVVNNCVPKFYKKLENNLYCVKAALKLALLYEGSERSMDLWRRIIDEDPKSSYASESKGMIYLVENYLDYDKNPLKLYFKAKLWSKKDVRESIIRELPKKYREIIDNYPQWKLTPYIYFLLGRYFEERYYYEKDKDACGEAISVFKSFLEKYTDSSFPPPLGDLKNVTPTVLIRLGDLYQATDPRQSIMYYEKIIQKYHDEIGDMFHWGRVKIAPFAYLRLGWMYESRFKQYKDAINTYRKVITKFPDYSQEYVGYPALTAHFRIVRIYSKYLNNPNAVKSELLEIYDKYPNSILIDLTAENQCEEVRESKAEVLLQLTILYLRENNYDKALENCRTLIDEFYNSSYGANQSEVCSTYGERAVYEIVNVRVVQKKPEMAIEELRNIVSTHQSRRVQAYAQYKLGELYELHLNDKKSAIEEYRKVLKKYPETTRPANMAKRRLRILKDK